MKVSRERSAEHAYDHLDDPQHDHPSGRDDRNDHEHSGERAHGHDHEAPEGVLARVAAKIRPHRHDHASSIDTALESNAKGIRALKTSLVALGITAVLQLVVFLFTNSVALLSDTLHNAADALTALPIWFAFTLARRPATRRFPYGYGRTEDVAGLIVVLFIAGSAAFALWESFSRLVAPTPVSHVWAVGLAGIIGFIGNELVARYRMRVGREIGSAALVADGMHARTDGFTSLGVLAGAVGVAIGFPAADPVAGIVIAILIVSVLWSAGRDVILRVLDAVEPGLIDETEQALARVQGVEAVGAVRIRWIGHRLHAEAEVMVDEGLRITEAHEIAEEARHAVLHDVPHLGSAIIHADPCGHSGDDPHADLAHHHRADRLGAAISTARSSS